MRPDMAIPLLLIGLVVAFTGGYLVGANGARPEPLPLNYNPTQAIVAEATKAAEAHVRDCYAQLAVVLQKHAEAH